jgi:drug/metabolite transporter (DMT)-like permease
LFVVLAAILLHERARPLEWVGIGGIIIAIFLLAWSIESGAAQGATDSAALTVLTMIGIAAAAAPSIDPRLRASGAAAAIASGIVFGLGSLYTKALADTFRASHLVELVANPWLYLTIVSNAAGLVMLQNAFHQARGIIAMPLSSACSNVVPIVGGMIAFGERLPAGSMAAAMRIAAFVITVGASALLATGEEHIAS